MTLALFPLPTFLLPGGITRLKIIEPRYLRLIHESVEDTGFVIATSLVNFEVTEEVANWGSWVKIVDFSMSEDELLTIDVQCQSMVSIESFEIEDDGLKRGEVHPYSHWHESQLGGHLKDQQLRNALTIQHALIQVFAQQESLSGLYSEPKFDSLLWACQRWVEILPLSRVQQNRFARPDSLSSACAFIQETLLGAE